MFHIHTLHIRNSEPIAYHFDYTSHPFFFSKPPTSVRSRCYVNAQLHPTIIPRYRARPAFAWPESVNPDKAGEECYFD